MARISLLFSLAFALALGSLFFSVSGHVSSGHKLVVSPKNVSELQTLPFTVMTEFLTRKERFAPNTAEFKAMFTMCKDYVAYLEGLYKYENPIVDVLGIAKAKFALMNKAIIAAQASVTGKVDEKTLLKLRKFCTELSKGFLQVKDTIVDISAIHHFKADAKINAYELVTLDRAMTSFKNSVYTFMNAAEDLEKEKMIKKIGRHARALDEDDDREGNAFERFFKKFNDRFGGHLGGNTHGRELTEEEFNANSHVGADVKGFEHFLEKLPHLFDGFLVGNSHGRRLTEPQAGVNAGAQVGGKIKGTSEGIFSKYFGSFSGGKAHGRKLAGVNVGAEVGGKVKGSAEKIYGKFSKFFGSFFGGKAHGRKLAQAQAGVNVGAEVGGKVKGSAEKIYGKFSKFFGSFFRGKAHGRTLAEAQVGVNAGAQVGGTFSKFFGSIFGGKSHGRELTEGGYIKGSLEDILKHKGIGYGNAQFDAAGVMKVAGENGFRSLNRPQSKHFDSTEA